MIQIEENISKLMKKISKINKNLDLKVKKHKRRKDRNKNNL
jgi:hypothetical protein